MKTAVVLFNLGGPDSQEAVKPFLRNLFSDKFILRLPWPLRPIAARAISSMRVGKAKSIYQMIGGKSPILENTLEQAKALEATLGSDYKTFVSMRYWHPMSASVAKNVKAWEPDNVILLPLYPQFSTTTSASSFSDWEASAKSAGLNAPTTRICCYPNEPNFLAAHATKIRDAYFTASEHGKPRILFSAHGLPEKISSNGDPYSWQVKETVAGVLKILMIEDVDYAICFQSRVGKMKWIGPYTEEEIERAAEDKVPVVMVPISFVSEHSETLAELDIIYKKLAAKLHVPDYQRVAALACDHFFIEALADICRGADKTEGVTSASKHRLCPRNFDKCPCAAAEDE